MSATNVVEINRTANELRVSLNTIQEAYAKNPSPSSRELMASAWRQSSSASP